MSRVGGHVRLTSHFVLVTMACFAPSTASAQDTWIRVVASDQIQEALDLAGTPDGGACIAGRIRPHGVGDTRPWVAKLDAAGQLLWEVAFQGEPEHRYTSLVGAPDGGCYVGVVIRSNPITPPSDTWLARLAADGSVLWQVRLDSGRGNDLLHCLALLPDGNIAAGGLMDAFPAFGWLVELDSTGALVGQRSLDGFMPIDAVTATADGGLTIAGRRLAASWLPIVVHFLADGSIGWARAWQFPERADPRCIQELEDGSYILAGEASVSGMASSTVFATRLDSGGNEQWQVQLERTGFSTWANSCDIRPDGTMLVGGHAFSDVSIDEDHSWWLRLDANGSIGWQQGLRVNILWSFSWLDDGRVGITGRHAFDTVVLRMHDNGFLGPPCPERRLSAMTLSGPVGVNMSTLVAPSPQAMTVYPENLATDVPGSTVADLCCPHSIPPAEVSPPGAQPLLIERRRALSFEDASSRRACWYNVYRGNLVDLRAGLGGATCIYSHTEERLLDVSANPPPGTGGWYYVVTGGNFAGEGTMGLDTLGRERPNTTPCP